MEGWLVRLGREVARRRDALGFKQDAFAEHLKISRDTLSAIENGSRSYTIEPLLQVLAGLHPKPADSLMDMAAGLDVLQPEEAAAVGDLIAVLGGDNRNERETVIRILKGFRKGPIASPTASAGKGRRHTS